MLWNSCAALLLRYFRYREALCRQQDKDGEDGRDKCVHRADEQTRARDGTLHGRRALEYCTAFGVADACRGRMAVSVANEPARGRFSSLLSTESLSRSHLQLHANSQGDCEQRREMEREWGSGAARTGRAEDSALQSLNLVQSFSERLRHSESVWEGERSKGAHTIHITRQNTFPCVQDSRHTIPAVSIVASPTYGVHGLQGFRRIHDMGREGISRFSPQITTPG